MIRRLLSGVLCLLALPVRVLPDAGVLLPRDKSQPDASVLSLEEMEITIEIDNGDARVYVRQIFANHTQGVQEGTYILALPSLATVSDFAVWDAPVRIPAVILERKRAEEIYNALKRQSVDPRLLQMGEREADEARRSNIFSAKITPIPGFGTKRLELEYHQTIPVENLKSYFVLPLRPDAYQVQQVQELTIHFQLHSAHPIRNFSLGGKLYPLQFDENDAHGVRGTFIGQAINLSEDFSVSYDLDPAGADKLEVLSYRNSTRGQTAPTETAPRVLESEPGFFEAQALLGFGQQANAAPGAVAKQNIRARTVVVLFDTSLSMQWEKLERSYAALERILHALGPGDRFNVILFNSEIARFQVRPLAADAAATGKAIGFVRASVLRGGTDLQAALKEGLVQCAGQESGAADLVLLSDGGATRGTIQNGQLAAWYAQQWEALPEMRRPRISIFAAGDDANLPLLRMIARNNGVLESVLSTEPLDFKLESFLSKIGRNPVSSLSLETIPFGSVNLVYPLQESVFGGSAVSWVGEYRAPASGVTFRVKGVRDGQPLNLSAKADLPPAALEHSQLPRLWARARVDALLEKIERDGEDQTTIDEIIRLSREYKFVTPYTSFLAVPRALLRPRVIRPGDPVLRVHTDASIVSIIALFPFGPLQALRYLPQEDVWQTRFLAPGDMRDGTYNVRLILRDNAGHTYRESKSFVIASTPPAVRIRTDRARYRRGETLALRVDASPSTRTLVARLEGVNSVYLHWSAQARASTGEILIPANMPAGTCRLTVTAEDIAHNTGTQEVQIEIVP